MSARDPAPVEVAALRAGDRQAVARALNLVEDQRPWAQREAATLLLALAGDVERGELIGITGPPGVGKSTLVSALIKRWRAKAKRVGVLAVDPTSPRSGGALLGDRLRVQRDGADEGVFWRSLAGRGDSGGLSAAVYPMTQVMLAAGFDMVVVETIGVGQAEVDVVDQTDMTLLLAQPGSGDAIQFLKAGILELPALIAVNKADVGSLAERTASELRSSLPPVRGAKGRVPVLLVSAETGLGVDELVAELRAQADRRLKREPRGTARRRQAEAWAIKRLRHEFGSSGLERLGGVERLRRCWAEEAISPFSALQRSRATLRALLGAASEE